MCVFDLTNKHLQKTTHYIHKSTQTKLVGWVMLKGTLKLLPFNTYMHKTYRFPQCKTKISFYLSNKVNIRN